MNKIELDLDEIALPICRLGFFGMSLFNDYDFSERKFNINVDVENNKITVNIEDENDFDDFIDGLWGNFENEYANPYKFTTNENEAGIYATACAHRGFTQLFIPKSARQKTKRCIATENDIEVGNFYLTDENRYSIKLKTYSSQLECSVKEKIKDRKKVIFSDENILANTFHPLYGLNNNIKADLTNKQRLLLAFSSLAYAYCNYGKFVIAIGMDADSISEFYEYFYSFMETRFYGFEKGQVHLPDVDWKVAAGIFANDIGLKPEKSYNVIYKKTYGKKKLLFINWLDYSKSNRELFSVFWESGKTLWAKSERANIFKLKNLILRKNSDKVLLDAYSQILKNKEIGVKWFSEFYWLASLDKKLSEKRILSELFNKLGDNMEKEIRDRFKSIIGSIAHSKNGVKKPYEFAIDFAVKQNLRTVVNKSTLFSSLSKIFVQAGRGFTEEQMDYLCSLNPCTARDLLIVSAYTFIDKNEKETEEEKEEENFDE